MSDKKETLVAVFADSEGLIEGARIMRRDGHKDLEALSPIPIEEIDEVLGEKPSPVRLFTLIGCLAGAVIGMGLQIGTVLQWPHLVGGKPPISLPAFVVVSFEMTILVGAIATLIGLFHNAKLPAFWKENYYDGCAQSDFALVVKCDLSERESVKVALTGTGAVEVKPIEEKPVWITTD